jgi:2-polyprenyl-3-methyl-5-hydroxy-6-metoxy-1,4-benzoquinol methylase
MLVKHRTDTGRSYNDILIHAAPRLHESVADVILQRFKKNRSILELGAGSGALTARLIDLGFTVVPVDLDGTSWKVNSVQVVEANLNDADWVDKLPVKKFDQVVAVELIEHLENPKKFLRDISGLLNEGGMAIITSPNVFCADSIIKVIFRQTFYCFDRTQYSESGHISILPAWLIELFAQDAGLKIQETRYVAETDKTGFKLLLSRSLAYLLRLLRRSSRTLAGDGIISLVVVSK